MHTLMQVVCGQDHTLFLTEDGRVFSSGLSADGQTGSDPLVQLILIHCYALGLASLLHGVGELNKILISYFCVLILWSMVALCVIALVFKICLLL